jgi:uncharacterized repeat protein (TIGR01451 family)
MKRSARMLSVLLILVSVLSSSLPGHTPTAEAAIANNPPDQSYGSLVDCLVPGERHRYATTCFGSKWSVGAYGSGSDEYDAPSTNTAIVTFYDAKPDQAASAGEDTTHETPASLARVGSVYGLAYRSQSETLFASAYVKRITRYGPGGPAAIYTVDPNSSGSTTHIITVPGADPGDIPQNPARATHDNATADLVGRRGLGDLAISPDESRLLVVDMSQKALHQFQATAPFSLLGSTLLPPAVAACPVEDDFRPMGVHERRAGSQNQLFVSFVCSGQARQRWDDVRVGALLSVDGAVTWTRAAFTTIDQQHNDPNINATNPERWTYWRSGVTECHGDYRCPQPMAASIDFLYDGRMVIGLRDRFADMTMAFNDKAVQIGIAAGDVIVLDTLTPTTWAGVRLAADGLEYLKDNNTHPSTVAYEHLFGAVQVVPGTHNGGTGQEIAATVADSYRDFTGNVTWFDYPDSSATQLNRTANEEIYEGNPHNFGKAAGMGDLEIICGYAQIGDRVWIDTNANGLQDSGESGQAGVVLEITQNGTSMRVTTDANGYWSMFLDPFAPATVQIISGVPSSFGPTLQFAGSDHERDSNANSAGRIDVPPLGFNRVNDPTFDIGLVNGSNVKIEKSGPATVPRGSPITYTLAWASDGPGISENTTIVDTLPTGVSFTSASPPPSSVSGQTLTWNLGTVSAGASGTITVNATVSTTAPSSLTNRVTISTTTPGDDPSDNTDTIITTVIAPNVRVTKSGPATVTAGATFAYTLSYGNNGQASATNVQLVDTLPAGVSYVSASPAPSSVSGQVLTWNLGTLAAGATGSITIQAQAAASVANGTTVTNSATISTTTPGDDPTDNTDTVPTVVQRADVAVTKSSPNTFPVLTGSTVTYYLDYTNHGPASAAGVQLVDTVPSQMSGVTWACTSGCSASGSGNAILINLGTLAAGASGRVTVTGTATTVLTSETMNNTVTISTTTPETRTDNNTSTVLGSVWTYDLQIVKLAQAQVVAGSTFTATLNYRNSGPATATGVVVQDTLPAGISFVSSSPAPSSVAGHVLTWNIGTLAPSATSTSISLVLRADAGLPDSSSVVNESRIGDSSGIPDPDRNTTNNDSDAITTVIARADTQISKTGPQRVASGDQISYTMVYTNTGPSIARSVVITDTLPGDVTFVSASPAPTSQNGALLTWNVGDLAPSAGGSITVVVSTIFDQIEPVVTVINEVVITSTTRDDTPENNRDTHETDIETVDLSVIKLMPPVVVSGSTFTVTLQWANAGPATARNVTLRDLLPINSPPLHVVSSTPAADGPGLRWNLGDLTAGMSGTIAIVLRMPTTAVSGTQYINTALIDTTTSRDRDPSNDISTTTTTVRPLADLSIVKTGPAGPLRSGTEIIYTLSYRNDGPSRAVSARIVDTMPNGFVFSSATPAPTSVTSPTLTWELGTLDAGTSGSITVRGVLHGSGIRSTHTNVAAISSSTDERDPRDNSSQVDTIVEKPDLEVIKTDGRTTVQPGDEVRYTITARNTGHYTATGVVLRELVPHGVSVASTDWVEGPNGIWIKPIGTLRPAQVVTATFTIVVPNPYPHATLLNTVIVEDDGSSGIDPTPENNRDEDEDTVRAGRIGDYVWVDLDKDGQQDSGEPPLPDVIIELLDDTGRVITTTTTNANGRYFFEGLRFDTRYTIRLEETQLLRTPLNDYDLTTPAQPSTVLTAQQPEDLDLDIGLAPQEGTAVLLRYLRALRQSDQSVQIEWSTVWEQRTASYRVLRSSDKEVKHATAVGSVIAKGKGDYVLLDTTAPEGSLFYWLIEIERDGTETVYGPISVRDQQSSAAHGIYLPHVTR